MNLTELLVRRELVDKRTYVRYATLVFLMLAVTTSGVRDIQAFFFALLAFFALSAFVNYHRPTLLGWAAVVAVPAVLAIFIGQLDVRSVIYFFSEEFQSFEKLRRWHAYAAIIMIYTPLLIGSIASSIALYKTKPEVARPQRGG